jgi:hypothetical protein
MHKHTVQAEYKPFKELKEISTTAVGRGGYEPTTVPITLGRKRSRYTTITIRIDAL